MVNCISLYIDESGTKNPDHRPGRVPAHGCDYFSYGGILIQESDESLARQIHNEFTGKWKISVPLHSVEIRSRSRNFGWLKGISKVELEEFLEDLYQIMSKIPAFGIACVIDRPGYDARYKPIYGRRRWHLCKTSFCIVVERAAKYAISQNAKLRVYAERSNKKDDSKVQEYYDELKASGSPFCGDNSKKYSPLTPEEFRGVLYDLKFKNKSSAMAQYADLYLWPMAMGGYDLGNRPFRRLNDDRKLIDTILPEADREVAGIKYSCFYLVKIKTYKQ